MSCPFLAFTPWCNSDAGVLSRLPILSFLRVLNFSFWFWDNSHPLNSPGMVVRYRMTHTLISCVKQGNNWCQGTGYGWVVESENPKNEGVTECVNYWSATEKPVRKANIKVLLMQIRLPDPFRNKLKLFMVHGVSLRRTEKSWRHVLVLIPSFTLPYPELHGITLNFILPVSESHKRNYFHSVYTKNLIDCTWVLSKDFVNSFPFAALLHNYIYMHKFQTGHVRWVELEEGRSYKLITKAMKPLLFGEW